MPIGGINERMLLAPSVLASIGTPIRFIWGADDPMGGEDLARGFVDQFPNADLEVLRDARHTPWIDYPDESAALTRDFFRS